MTNLEKAKELRDEGGFTCVLHKDGVTYTSTERGVVPLLKWLDEGLEVKGFSAADKVVGKAAAMLFALLGVSEVHTYVMSEAALEELSHRGINGSCDILAKLIINRQGTGRCPMEETVMDIEDLSEAVAAIKMKLRELAAKN